MSKLCLRGQTQLLWPHPVVDGLANAGQISRESAVKAIADTFDIEDVPAELARIAADQDTNGSN